MIINNLYDLFLRAFDQSQRKGIRKILESDPMLKSLANMALDWGQDLENVERWMRSPEYRVQETLAKNFILQAPGVIEKVEDTFKMSLPGEVRLSPSMMRFDGFARYDRGHHTVWFGVDHPDADEAYLKVLMAHELSHVYRDHQPRVWAHLGKPLSQVSRTEYLDATEALEHLASEGLATLHSQVVYPEVPLHVHHYYLEPEMQWCLQHRAEIGKAIKECLGSDENVWKFYEEDQVGPGSPSRVQYYWAAQVLSAWLPRYTGLSLKEAILIGHGLPAKEFECFKV